MYLENIIDNNPELLEVMINFHQKGLIPPNTWVIDLDTIAANAKILASTAKKLGLITYLMSKQHNRNPYINKLALACGLNKMVAVDIQGVLAHRRYNVPLGHAGHLNQIPGNLVWNTLKRKITMSKNSKKTNQNKKSTLFSCFHKRHFSSQEELADFNREYFAKLEAKNAPKKEIDVPETSENKKSKKDSKE